MITVFNLKRQYLLLKKEIDDVIKAVIRDSAFSDGPYVDRFAADFAKYIGTAYAVPVNNGTSALFLALKTAGIKKGDEVIVPVNTFIATAWAISHTGAKPVFVDCDSETWEIDTKILANKITKKTKAIIGVHLFGQPFDVDKVKQIGQKYNLRIFEDCAQAHGAIYKDRKVGSFGLSAAFSFYPSKNLGAMGEGGAITTSSRIMAENIKMLANQGSLKKNLHEQIGFNMRMEGIQAAILSVKLKYLDSWNKRRQKIGERYRKEINNPAVIFQRQLENTLPVYHLFPVKVKERDRFREFLNKRGIETIVHYPTPCHLQPAYKNLGYRIGDFPNAEHLSKSTVSIPINPELTEDEIKKIINSINKYE